MVLHEVPCSPERTCITKNNPCPCNIRDTHATLTTPSLGGCNIVAGCQAPNHQASIGAPGVDGISCGFLRTLWILFSPANAALLVPVDPCESCCSPMDPLDPVDHCSPMDPWIFVDSLIYHLLRTLFAWRKLSSICPLPFCAIFGHRHDLYHEVAS